MGSPGSAPPGSPAKAFLVAGVCKTHPSPCGSSGAWEAVSSPCPSSSSEVMRLPSVLTPLRQCFSPRRPPLHQNRMGPVGWGALSPGRGAAWLPKGHSQNWKPVTGHIRGPPRVVAWAGETNPHLERSASSILTHQRSFSSPPSPSLWPAGSWWGLAGCPDAMLSICPALPRAPGAPWRDMEWRQGCTRVSWCL